jgi:DNA-directed RNA polymerase sigma subunit (sigma70/sigma32)
MASPRDMTSHGRNEFGGFTLDVISKSMNMSKQRVSQILHEAMAKMRENASDDLKRHFGLTIERRTEG